MNIQQYYISLLDTLNHPFNKSQKFLTLSKIIFWKLNQWFFHVPVIIEIVPGIKCLCYPDSSYGGMVVYSRWPDYSVIKSITSLVGRNGTFVDVGANIGVMTLAAAEYTKGRIISFEPSSVAYSRLLENLQLNNLQGRVIAENMALANRSGQLAFVEEKTPETSHLSHENKGHKVHTITLDQYAKTQNIHKIDVLKIDVEGAEMLALKGAAKLLADHRIKHILLELNVAGLAYGYTNSDVVKYLKSFGYKISRLPPKLDERIVNIHAYSAR